MALFFFDTYFSLVGITAAAAAVAAGVAAVVAIRANMEIMRILATRIKFHKVFVHLN